MKNILLLTDFSENSINAMRYALNLFENDSCQFYLLHAESPQNYTTDNFILSGNESIYDSVLKKSEQKLGELAVGLKKEFENKNFELETIVDYDVLTDSIKQIISSKNIELIVMGTNGVTGAKEALFGSNTINVMRKVECPTLVIPEGFKYKKPNDILLPLDLFDSLSGKAFMQLMEFVHRFSKTLHLLRIKPRNEDSEEEKKDQGHIDYFLNETDYKYHVINNVPLQYVVHCYSQTHSIDLTTLLVQKESLFERFFIGSPTTIISNETLVPLLIFHS